MLEADVEAQALEEDDDLGDEAIRDQLVNTLEDG
jgi:hypothetical protein